MKILIPLFVLTSLIALYFSGSEKDLEIKRPTADIYTVQKDSVLVNSIKRGAVVYEDFCMQCHMATGKGVAGTFPPLADSDYLNMRTESIKAVKYGLKGKVTVNGTMYNSIMPSPGLYDDEVADVMNYIFNSWDNKAKLVIESEVSKIEK